MDWHQTLVAWCHIDYQQLMGQGEDRNETRRPLNLFNHKAYNLLMVEVVSS